MLKSIRKIERYLQGVDVEKFREIGMETDATLYNLFIIGEAASHVPSSIQVKYPQVNWRGIRGFRNVVAHEYFRLNIDLVWSITQEDLPELKEQVIEIIDKEHDSDSAQ
jgi:uncharacterized protein with HEPN domain